MTLLELYSQVVADAGILGNKDFPYQRVVRIINDAQKSIQVELNGLGFKRWERAKELTLDNDTYNGIQVSRSNLPEILETPDSLLYISTAKTVPDSILGAEEGGIIIAEEGEEIVVSLSDIHGIARAVEPIDFADMIGNGYLRPTTKEPRFTRLANYIFIYPRINIAVVYYLGTIEDLVEETDITKIPVNFIPFIIKKAVMDINPKPQDYNEFKTDLANAYQKYMGIQAEKTVIKDKKDAVLQ